MNIVELEDGSILCGKDATLEVAMVDKAMVAMVSTEVVDTDGDVIHASKNARGMGWDLADFNRNPIVLWSHDPRVPSIAGPSVKAKVGKREGGGKALYLDPFAFDMSDPFAAGIAGKYERGVLKQTSVGFIGKIWDRRMEGDMMVGREYFEQKLIEVSCVNVGANQETDTVVKRMLSRCGVAAKVQDCGDSEIRELKALIQHLTEDQEYLKQELRLLGNAVKGFAEKDFGGHDEAAVIAAAANHAAGDLDLAAMAMLLRLKSLGTAR